MRVRGFEQYLDPQNHEDILTSPREPFAPRIDPVRTLWTTFRKGAPLCALFNALQPKDPLEVKTEFQDLSNTNSCKASVYHFILACKKELFFREDQLFTITELYKDDTNGFVKVIKTVSEVLDLIEKRGLLVTPRRPSLRYSEPDRPSDAPIGNREKVVSELLETERKYVADLEILQTYMRKLRQEGIVSFETIRNLFANLNTLVDFQRRFLIGVEANAHLPPNDQRFGALFVQMEENFAVYEPFCANYSSASALAIQETPNLKKLSHVLEPAYALPALLIKPIQRICKYPLLLRELIKYTEPTTHDFYDELLEGCEAIKRVTDRVNEERRKEENLVTVNELEQRVEDWKGHSVDSFGALLLSDKFVMATNDVERELNVFLFEKILLCCKESGSSKKRSAGAAQFALMIRSSTKSASATPKKPGLQLKGRIFITSVTGVNNNSTNGQNALKVFWRDIEMESFALQCRNEEQLKLWKSTLSRLVEESNKEKEALTARNGTQRSTNSPSNLDSNVVTLNLQRGDRSEGQNATYQTPYYGKAEENRDDDGVSFIIASDDEEDEKDKEEEDLAADQSWDSRGRIPRGRSNQTHVRPLAKSDGSESENRSRGEESNTVQESTEPTSYDFYDDLLEGRDAVGRVSDAVLEEPREENLAMFNELQQRVEDWRGHSVDSYGALKLSDIFVMAKNDVERELHVFLFEQILLCCKETGSTKKRSAGAEQFPSMIRSSMKSASTTSKKPGLELKGRIFIASITGVINNSKNGQHALKVFWRDVEMESFILKCNSEEQMKLWKSTLSRLVEDSNKEKEAFTARNRTQRSAPNLDSNAVLLDLQREMAGPGTYQTTIVGTPKGKSRDDDAVSFNNASDEEEDEEDDEEDSAGVKPSSRGRIPRGSSSQMHIRPLSKYDGSRSSSGMTPDYRNPNRSSTPQPYPTNLPGMSFPPLPRNRASYRRQSNVYPTSPPQTTPANRDPVYPASPPRTNPTNRNSSVYPASPPRSATRNQNNIYPASPPRSTPTSPSKSHERQAEESTNPSRRSETIAGYLKVTSKTDLYGSGTSRYKQNP